MENPNTDPHLCEALTRKSPFSSQLRALYFSLLGPVLGSSGTFFLLIPFPCLDYGDFPEAGRNEACFNPGTGTQQLCYLAGSQLLLPAFPHRLA